MGPLTVVHVLTHENATRGGAIQALLLAQAQKAAGHAVEVVCNAAPGLPLDPTFERWTDGGLSLRPCVMFRGKEILKFRRFLAEVGPDVVHVHRDTALVFTYLATLLAAPPAFISQRGTTHPFRTRTAAFVHHSPRVHRIIAVAQAVKDTLAGFGVDPRRVEVVYGSFDVDRFDPATARRDRVRRELGLTDEQRLVLQVGELHPKKAPVTFVETAAKLAARRPEVVCALAGKGKLWDTCRARIAESGSGGRILMLGFRSDIADVFAAADVVVNSSTGHEGLTGAVREALALAKPLAATWVDGNPEAVRHEETGLLVPPRDPDAMVAAVCRLLDHPDWARTLGLAGRELIVRHMHPAVRVRRTEEVYRQVLAERSAGAGSAPPDHACASA
ncbi:MAG: glycosyltransferase family 4 protein [Planctomycetes bacterium]|nr:glycosyltransferase family 4 protein [Planctomycetota bacterium]